VKEWQNAQKRVLKKHQRKPQVKNLLKNEKEKKKIKMEK